MVMARWRFNNHLKHLLPQVMEKGEIGLDLGNITLLEDDPEFQNYPVPVPFPTTVREGVLFLVRSKNG